MTQYRVSIPKVVWFTTTVDAADGEAAIEQAYGMAPEQLCAHCSGWGQKWSVDGDEWGGCEDLHPNLNVSAELVEGAR